MPSDRRFGASILLASLVLVEPAVAQVQRSGGGGAANMQLYQQYQQAVSERAQAQAESAKLKKDVDDLKKQLAAAKQQLAGAQSGARRTEAERVQAQEASDASNKSLADLKGQMQKLIDRFKETIGTLEGVEIDRNQFKTQLTQSQAAFDQCAEDNFALYQVNGEVLDRYAHQGPFSYLARAEPFTQIKRTQIDNLVLEYRQRAEELRLKKAAPPGAAAPPPPGGTSGSTSPPKATETSPLISTPPAPSPSPAAPATAPPR